MNRLTVRRATAVALWGAAVATSFTPAFPAGVNRCLVGSAVCATVWAMRTSAEQVMLGFRVEYLERRVKALNRALADAYGHAGIPPPLGALIPMTRRSASRKHPA